MKRLLLVLAAVALASCVPAEPNTPANDVPQAAPLPVSEGGYLDLGDGVFMRCHNGRAIYTIYQGGIAVVPDAQECIRQ